MAGALVRDVMVTMSSNRPLQEELLMVSLNFEFLRAASTSATDLLGLAEKYSHTDPRSSVVKLREFAELLVEFIYNKRHFPRPYQASINDLLQQEVFVETTPRVVVDNLHLLRKLGNRGAHPERGSRPVETRDALNGLNHAFSLAKWLYVEHIGGRSSDCPAAFQDPPPDSTPVQFVERNTYRLFRCEDRDPTFNYEYDDAVREHHLVPFEVVGVTT